MNQAEPADKLANLRHSLAHLLAAAIMELYPDTKRTIGPAIDNGFYFDFEFSSPVSDADLPQIEKKMREILPSWNTFERHELTADEAKKEYPDNPYKWELIEEFTKDGQKVSFYKSGEYWDLCRGGHAENMSGVDPEGFKLDRVAGAYWRGDEKNKMLTRIYGLAFETKAELEAYIKQREEAEKRDHKKLGKELDLFTFSDLVGGGLPLFTPKGTMVFDLLDNFVGELRRAAGYQKVDIPHITKRELYEKSGHWEKFKNDLFIIKTREEHVFAMKPMNCPHHIQIFKRKQWSYKELPVSYSSTTKVYRDEQSGELGGLTRVRSITQDDAHVFCRLNQVGGEIEKIYKIVKTFYGAFGFVLKPRLSMHDPNNMNAYLGSEEVWINSENSLREIVKRNGETPIEAPGEAAFYGPKIDFLAKDAIGRDHQVATIQLDMNMPERFDTYCINEKGEQERTVMVHTAIMGSIERFMSILIEHVAGAFPLWLSPVQVKVIPVRTNHNEYAQKIFERLQELGIRVELDNADENLGSKVRSAKTSKIPYWLVIGDKELAANKVNLESRDKGTLGLISPEELEAKLLEEINAKK